MRKLWIAAGCTLFLMSTLGATQAGAGTETLAVRGSDTVQSPSGDYRVFFQVTAPVKTDVVIRQATLRFPYAALGTEARGVALRVMPVTAPWNLGAASWTGWSRPGGDYDEELYSDVVLEASRGGTAAVDVTVAVKEWIEDGQGSYGFLVTVPSPVREGLDEADLGILSSLGSAVLEIESMPLTGPRKGRKGRGG